MNKPNTKQNSAGESTTQDVHRLVAERKRKREDLISQGINPYPHLFEPTHKTAELHKKYGKLEKDQASGDTAKVAGRIRSMRQMGKVAFMDLHDVSGKIQLFFRADDIGKDVYKQLKLYDIGDIVGAEGEVICSKTGELSIRVASFTMLAKSLQPLPDKFHGITNREVRYRQRYVDLIMNAEVREVMLKRSKIISCIRRFLDEKDFVEVETPTLQPIYGGANARPFVTKHNALDMTMYLRISDELYLKRLTVGGFDRVYEICKDFRNEGIDTSHNPEFTMIEWYQAYGDYETGMKMVEELYSTVAKEVTGSTKIKFKGHEIELAPPWRRATMVDLIKDKTNKDVMSMSQEEIFEWLSSEGADVAKDQAKGSLIQEAFEHFCEEDLIQPTFVIDHPVETTPLCKAMRDGPKDFVERFEPFIAGFEIGNAYSELNDPVVQDELFKAQVEAGKKGDDEHHPMDDDYVRALEYGMPPTSGVGLGIDRMVMLLTGQESIRDVMLFPTLRPGEGEDQ